MCFGFFFLSPDDTPLELLIPAGDVAYGLAWSYFYGYLKLILPGFQKRVAEYFKNNLNEDLKRANKDPCSVVGKLPKFFCVLPVSGNCPKDFETEDRNIETIGEVKYSMTVAGNVDRDYKSCVHVVTHPVHPEKVN